MPTPLSYYWHTLRHLKPVQFYGRLRYRLHKPTPNLTPAPQLRPPPAAWREPARRRPSLFGSCCFRFLNETHSLTDAGWDSPAIEKLWRYNLHYFDDLNAEDAAARCDWHHALIRRWIGENPPGAGTGWEPYPTSLRIVNWITWALAGNAVSPDWQQSVAVQARWLTERLERHLLGNHLFANAKALIFAGLFFDGAEAEGWLQLGARLLAREMPEQILSDGGQFELSTMYHALALEDLLDLYNITRAFQGVRALQRYGWIAQLPDTIARMQQWLAAMCHPDGEIGFFNDAALGIAPSPGQLAEYARRLGLPVMGCPADGVVHLKESGYLRYQSGPMTCLLDVAAVGPEYLPGHAHADTLSLELSLYGQRVLVNSGTSCYGTGTERGRQRGTAAHNTVAIDGADSSEVWGGFRVARRAYPRDLQITRRDDGCELSCSHDGYRWLPGKPRHTRTVRLRSGELTVEDRIAGRFRTAAARFHLHPSIAIDAIEANGTATVVLTLPAQQKIRMTFDGGVVRAESSTWHPEFGTNLVNSCLNVEFTGDRVTTRISMEI